MFIYIVITVILNSISDLVVLIQSFKINAVTHVKVNATVPLKLYQKLGFEIKETIPKYYSDDADAYYMELVLDPL